MPCDTRTSEVPKDMLHFPFHQSRWLRSSELPLYEYRCVKCGHRFEKIENVSASERKKCVKCGNKAERLVAAPAIQFKGSGWYVTDYAGKKTGAPSNENSGDSSASKPQEKTAESKTSEVTKNSPEKGSAKKKK